PAPRFAHYAHRPENGNQQVVVVDIDGTLALHVDRSPYDYTRVSTDAPNEPIVQLVRSLKDDYRIVYVSGRKDSCREDTVAWLEKHVDVDGDLLMRRADDDRPDYIVKNEIYDECIIPNCNIAFAIDDRDQVVRHVRNRGI